MLDFLFSPPLSVDVALLVARVIVGAVMLYYGWPKIRNLKSNAGDFVHMGFKPGWFWGTTIALVEFAGGIGMILGIAVPFVALLFGFEMLSGAIWKFTKTDKPFTDWSYDLLLLALALLFIAFGAGQYVLL